MQKERKDKNFIRKPVYPGGPTAMRKFIRENLVYPEEALKQKIQGTVSLRYTINHLGAVIDTHVIAGLGYGCDEEAQRLVRLFRFDVSKTRGVKVLFHNEMHIHFRLPKKKIESPGPKQQNQSVQYVYSSSEKKTPLVPVANTGYQYTITIPTKKKEED